MIELPKECIVDKFISKKTFYERVNISNTIKQEFIDKVEKITWKYKISEDTMNISKTEDVEEIEMFELELREKYNSKNLINIITRNIPYPILFYIRYENEFRYAIKYNEDIFFSEWNVPVAFCFSGLNLQVVYDNIVKAVTNIESDTNNLKNELEKRQARKVIQNEITRLESKIKKEQQFNKKVELNKILLQLKQKEKEME